MGLLTVEALDLRYGRFRAVRGVSLSILRGEVVALIGANRAGKTTFLRAAVGWALQRLFLERAARGGELLPILSTFGLAIVLDTVMFQIFGANANANANAKGMLQFPGDLAFAAYDLPGGISVGKLPVWMLATAIVVLGGLHLMLTRTTLGRRIRATAMDPFLAMVLGAVAVGVLAWPISLFMLRLKGGEFSIGMWVLASMGQLCVKLDPMIQGETASSLISLNACGADIWRDPIYWGALAAMTLLLGALFALLRSREGLAIQAIRDGEEAALSLGVRPERTKRLLFVPASFGIPNEAGYPVSNVILLVWTMMAAHQAQFKSRGIRLNAVAPVPVETPILMQFRAVPGDARVDNDIARLGRAGTALDVALVVLFLCSAAARWINGANIAADGGHEGSTPAEVLGF